ncbi:MAG: prominin family protein [Bacteroides sp.]|nr:prominin family protein [Bacteroides sp.]
MSFAGHVFDMINRSKQNRELLNLRRERAKGKKKAMGLGSQIGPDVTLQEYERVNRQLKEREKEQERYIFRTTIKIVVAGCILLLIVICMIGLLFGNR